MKIRLAADLQSDSIVDGLGVRTVIWTQGCSHNCPGCQNPQTHDFNGGGLIDIDLVKGAIDELEDLMLGFDELHPKRSELMDDMTQKIVASTLFPPLADWEMLMREVEKLKIFGKRGGKKRLSTTIKKNSEKIVGGRKKNICKIL